VETGVFFEEHLLQVGQKGGKRMLQTQAIW